MNGTLTQQFSAFRVRSVARPNDFAGLIECYGSFTRQQLEAYTAGEIGFYADDFLMKGRGDMRHTEGFVLQGRSSLGGIWEDIMPIVPLPGDPDDMYDDEEDGRWGQCKRCKRNLTENEAGHDGACESCRPDIYTEWEANQERLQEEADERRRYPEESDGDYYDEYDDDYE